MATKLWKKLWVRQLLLRMKLDWREWKNHQETMWRIKREKKLIQRAIARAQLKNSFDNRTYYIMKNGDGNPEEFRSDECTALRRKEIIPRNVSNVMLREWAIAVVTSNEVIHNHFVSTQAEKRDSDPLHIEK